MSRDYFYINDMTFGLWLGIYLAFVSSSVALLDISYLQSPRACIFARITMQYLVSDVPSSINIKF